MGSRGTVDNAAGIRSSRGVPRPARVFFTAFEPSADDLGAAVITAFKARRPDARVYALGGPKMEAAGATLVERTGENPVMGLPGIETIVEHAELNDRVEGWLADHPIDLHVPVDSPAANFPVCKLTKRAGAKIVHVVAPQLWAWGPWRVRKLRRLTDLVLCLLPFEPAWFAARGVPAEFIGHPMYDHPLAPAPEKVGDPAVGVLPGSRSREFQRVFPLQLEMLRAVSAHRPGLRARLAAISERALEEMRGVAAAHGGWPANLEPVVGDVDGVIAGSDLVLACSGTVSLRVARHRTPMVVVYRVEPVGYALLGKRLVSAHDRALPNLAAGRRVVPEFIPLEGPAQPAIAAAEALLADPEHRRAQAAELDRVARMFEGRKAAEEAAKRLAEVCDVA